MTATNRKERSRSKLQTIQPIADTGDDNFHRQIGYLTVSARFDVSLGGKRPHHLRALATCTPLAQSTVPYCRGDDTAGSYFRLVMRSVASSAWTLGSGEGASVASPAVSKADR